MSGGGRASRPSFRPSFTPTYTAHLHMDIHPFLLICPAETRPCRNGRCLRRARRPDHRPIRLGQSVWGSPFGAVPLGHQCDPFGAMPLGHQCMAGYSLDRAIIESPRELDTLPFWGYVSEEAVPAPIDSMARGVVPIRVKPTGNMTDSVLLVPGDQIPTAGIGTGKNLLKPPASVCREPVAKHRRPSSPPMTTNKQRLQRR